MYTMALHPDRRLAVFEFQGEVPLSEGSAAFLEYVQRPEFQPDALMVTDARGVTKASGSFLDILRTVQGLGGAFRRFRKAAKSIVLVENDEQLGTALVLMQVLDLLGPIEMVVIRTENELLAQSGLTLQDLDQLKPAFSKGMRH